MRYFVQLRSRGLLFRLAVLTLVNVVLLAVVLSIGYGIKGADSLRWGLGANLVCWLSFSLSLVAVEPFRRHDQWLPGMLLAMLVQIGGPMGAFLAVRMKAERSVQLAFGGYLIVFLELLLAVTVLLILPAKTVLGTPKSDTEEAFRDPTEDGKNGPNS